MNESTLSILIKENLLFLTKKYNISEAELSRQAKLPQATINRLLKGATEDPRASTLKSIADFFNISVDQLLSNNLLQESSFDTTRLPIYSFEQTKNVLKYFIQDRDEDLSHILKKREGSYLEVEPSISANCLAFEVKGDSMWPQFIEGIFIVVDTKLKAKHRDFVVYVLADSQQLILRQYIEEGQDHILKPINYGYKLHQITKKDKFIGTVIQAKNDFRKVSSGTNK
jgi:transcriptional regulator with XRE-family HTH domain